MKFVIYKDLTGYKTTTIENYNARIQNARRVTTWTGFNSAREIIDYCVKYYGSSENDFIIKEA